MDRRWLLVILLSVPAWGYSARLLDAADPGGPSLTPITSGGESPREPTWKLQAGGGAVAALVTVPASLYLAQWIGGLSNSIYVSLIPAFLVMAIVPAVAVAAVVTLIGNWASPGKYRFLPTLGITALANVLALVVGVAAGFSVGLASRVVVFTILEAVLLPAAATGSANLFARRNDSGAVAWSSRDPRSPLTWVVPTGEVHF